MLATDASEELERIADWSRERLAVQPDARLLVLMPGAPEARERLVTLIRQSIDPAAAISAPLGEDGTSTIAAIAVTFTVSTALAGAAFAASDKRHPDRPAAKKARALGEYCASASIGSPSESGTNENVAPAPRFQHGPADPAAADNPAARIPTDKDE